MPGALHAAVFNPSNDLSWSSSHSSTNLTSADWRIIETEGRLSLCTRWWVSDSKHWARGNHTAHPLFLGVTILWLHPPFEGHILVHLASLYVRSDEHHTRTFSSAHKDHDYVHNPQHPIIVGNVIWILSESVVLLMILEWWPSVRSCWTTRACNCMLYGLISFGISHE